MSQKRKIAILGGGLAGLACRYCLGDVNQRYPVLRIKFKYIAHRVSINIQAVGHFQNRG